MRLPEPEASAAAADAAGNPRPSPRFDQSFAGLRRDDQRVANVAWRLETANVALCSDVAPLNGLVLQSALEYAPRVRAEAEAAFGLGDRPAVEAVAAGSPAAVAGLQPGDILIAVAGATLPVPAKPPGPDNRPKSDAPVADAERELADVLAAGPASVTVLRNGAPLSVTLRARSGCAYPMLVFPAAQRQAAADGRQVFISTAMVSFADTDGRLALVLGHELAHNVLHHRERLDRAGFARSILGALGSSPSSLVLTEKEADYVGLYLTARAGYDISRAPDFWRSAPDGADALDWAHPPTAERVAALAATRDEIDRKRALGEPLIPQFIPGAGP